MIIRREDLTAAEIKTLEQRYAPYHRFKAFWTGYRAYQGEAGRYRCPYGGWRDVFSQAWHRGANAALHVRWERKMPARDEYEQDDRDSEKQIEGFKWGIEELRKQGTLPKPYKKAATPANDNDGHPPL
jgi:hypothetical protein